jgi:hypothetical protein
MLVNIYEIAETTLFLTILELFFFAYFPYIHTMKSVVVFPPPIESAGAYAF